jgi:hypothetical protein
VVNSLSHPDIIHISGRKKEPVGNVKWKVLKILRKGIKLRFRNNDTAIHHHCGTRGDRLSDEDTISTRASLSNFKAGMNPIRTPRLRLG